MSAEKIPFVPEQIEGYVSLPFMEVVMDSLEHNDRLLLVGSCGVGKTSSVEQIASQQNWGLRRVNLNGQTTVSDLVGQWIAKGGEVIWVDGVLPQAMRSGHILILDEIDFAPPEILAVLHGVLEEGGSLVLAENGAEVVVPANGFRMVGTANTIGADADERGLYQGTNVMNEAFLDRWSTVVQVTWPPAEIEVDILTRRVPGLPVSVATLIVRMAGEVRAAFEQKTVFTTFSPRKCLQLAEKALRYGDLGKAVEVTVLNKLGSDDREVVKGVVQRWIGSKV